MNRSSLSNPLSYLVKGALSFVNRNCEAQLNYYSIIV